MPNIASSSLIASYTRSVRTCVISLREYGGAILGVGDDRPVAAAGSPPAAPVESRLGMVPELEDAILGVI